VTVRAVAGMRRMLKVIRPEVGEDPGSSNSPEFFEGREMKQYIHLAPYEKIEIRE
jgi:hypothetical protein